MGFKVVLLAQGWNSSKPTLSEVNALGQLVKTQSSYLLKNQGLHINQVDPYYGNYLLDFDSTCSLACLQKGKERAMW